MVVIGSLLPLTGDGAAYGVEIRNGIDLAVDKINTTGGLQGRKLSVSYEDTKGDPTTAVSAIQSLLARQRVPTIIGDSFSGSTLALIPVIERERVVLLSPTASSPKLTGASAFFFRNWPSDSIEATVMAAVATSRLGRKSFGVLYSNSEYGVGLKNAFVKKVRYLGGTVIGEEAFREKDTDFRTQLQNLNAKKPDAIYLTGYYQEFALILKQAKELGVRAQFLSYGTFHEPQVLSLSRGAAEGVVFVQPFYDPDSPEPIVAEFVAAFKKKYQTAPGLYAAHGYDAGLLLGEAMRTAANTPTAERIRDALLAIKDFPGVTGSTTFDSKGDVKKPSRIMTVRDGKFQPL